MGIVHSLQGKSNLHRRKVYLGEGKEGIVR